MEEKKCRNCGAPLKSKGFGRYHCDYCGSEYQEDKYKDQVCYITVQSPQCHTLVCDYALDDYIPRDNPDLASKIVVDHLAASLADTIKDYMTIRTSHDYMHNTEIYRGMIRIVPEGYRYT